jgi:hypothetical protein
MWRVGDLSFPPEKWGKNRHPNKNKMDFLQREKTGSVWKNPEKISNNPSKIVKDVDILLKISCLSCLFAFPSPQDALKFGSCAKSGESSCPN